MGAAAGRAVEPLDVDHPDAAALLGRAAEPEAGKFRLVDLADLHRPVLEYDPVGEVFHLSR